MTIYQTKINSLLARLIVFYEKIEKQANIKPFIIRGYLYKLLDLPANYLLGEKKKN